MVADTQHKNKEFVIPAQKQTRKLIQHTPTTNLTRLRITKKNQAQ
jgi:hypothetical protein